MKTFDLSATKISKLNPVEIKELKKYLMSCKFSDRVKFALHIMDIEYNLSFDDDVQKKIEKFFNDKMFKERMFKNVMEIILKDENNENLSESEWLEIDNNYIRKIRRKKLKKLNHENV